MNIQNAIDVLNAIKEEHGPDQEIRFWVRDYYSRGHLASAEWDTTGSFWSGVSVHMNETTLFIDLEENHEGKQPKVTFRKEK